MLIENRFGANDEESSYKYHHAGQQRRILKIRVRIVLVTAVQIEIPIAKGQHVACTLIYRYIYSHKSKKPIAKK